MIIKGAINVGSVSSRWYCGPPTESIFKQNCYVEEHGRTETQS